MNTYPYSNGLDEQQLKALIESPRTATTDYIKTTDGRFFQAKPRRYQWPHGCNKPHLEEVTAVFPNGKTAQYCVNLNNGIATYIKFN